MNNKFGNPKALAPLTPGASPAPVLVNALAQRAPQVVTMLVQGREPRLALRARVDAIAAPHGMRMEATRELAFVLQHPSSLSPELRDQLFRALIGLWDPALYRLE
jgi:hypothetical protein